MKAVFAEKYGGPDVLMIRDVSQKRFISDRWLKLTGTWRRGINESTQLLL